MTFGASEEMAGYRCEVQPMEMQGDVTVEEGDEGATDTNDEESE